MTKTMSDLWAEASEVAALLTQCSDECVIERTGLLQRREELERAICAAAVRENTRLREILQTIVSQLAHNELTAPRVGIRQDLPLHGGQVYAVVFNATLHDAVTRAHKVLLE